MFSRIKQLSGATARLFSTSAPVVKQAKPLSMGTQYVAAVVESKKPGLDVVESICLEDARAGYFAQAGNVQRKPSVELVDIDIKEEANRSYSPVRAR